MDFSVRGLLSGVRDGAAEVGEILATAGRVEDGNADSWLGEFCGLGRRLTEQATESAGVGRERTAWGQALRAANYLFGGAWWAPATHRSGVMDSLWAQHRRAWDLAVSLWPPPASAESVPTPLGELPGYRFSASADGPGRGVVLMVQGLDTPLSDAAMTGPSEGLRRGWEVALVEGPGQGAALLRDGLTLAGGWDGVVAAAGRWARPDPGFPLVAMGINHGSWCVPTTKLLVRSAALGDIPDLPEDTGAWWSTNGDLLTTQVLKQPTGTYQGGPASIASYDLDDPKGPVAVLFGPIPLPFEANAMELVGIFIPDGHGRFSYDAARDEARLRFPPEAHGASLAAADPGST